MKQMISTMLPLGGLLFFIGSGINYLQDKDTYSLIWTVGSLIVFTGSLVYNYLKEK